MINRPILALSISFGCLTVTNNAWSFHTEDERITDRTAYTMQNQHLRLGLFRAD